VGSLQHDDCYARYDRSITARYKAYLAGSCSDKIGGTRSIIVDQLTLSINEDTDWNEKRVPGAAGAV